MFVHNTDSNKYVNFALQNLFIEPKKIITYKTTLKLIVSYRFETLTHDTRREKYMVHKWCTEEKS